MTTNVELLLYLGFFLAGLALAAFYYAVIRDITK